ncbi:MAG: ethanolamine ammonia-lyase subunit EutC [Oscillospiraceae bacterium]|nr:ethanolamine ammonia-lyase subunit EutC [Oscillospiraceae bacterium]
MNERVNPELIAAVVEEVIKQLMTTGNVNLPSCASPARSFEGKDISSPEVKAVPLLDRIEDPDALERMMKKTTARIGVGRSGPRLKTQTLLALRADHAQARDAVFADVDEKVIREANLFTVQTLCDDKNTFITRPDLGRKLNDEAVKTLRERCTPNPDVQIYAADGLSSTAIEANLNKILPVLTDALKAAGLKVGTPFYLRFGRVGSQEHVAEVLGAKVVCTLIGERPGLATAESMSAYIAYNAYVGMPEAKRTVVSNIHKDGTAAVEAGAYIAEVIRKIYDQKASGVDLVK